MSESKLELTRDRTVQYTHEAVLTVTPAASETVLNQIMSYIGSVNEMASAIDIDGVTYSFTFSVDEECLLDECGVWNELEAAAESS